MTPEDYEDAVFKHALEVSCEEPMAEAYARGFNAGLEEALRMLDQDEDGDIDFIKFQLRARLSQKEET